MAQYAAKKQGAVVWWTPLACKPGQPLCLNRNSSQPRRDDDAMNDQRRYMQLIDEVVQSICPSSLSLHLSRIDSEASRAHPSIFEADKNTFRVKKWQTFVRQARYAEFDYSPDSHL